MPTTSPDNIYYADGSTPMSAEAISAAEATSVQAALNAKINNTRQIQSFVWANAAARNAQTGMTEGDVGYQLDNNTNYLYTGTAWIARYSGGLVPIVPTSVAGTGVSLNATTGLVTFSAATTISVNGCFTSTFRNYLILPVVTSRSTNSFTAFKLRASGTDLSTGYDLVRTIRAGTATTAQLANNTDVPLGSGNFPSAQHRVEVFDPQLSSQTRLMSRTVESQAAAAPTIVEVDGSTRSTSAYDGFSLIAAAGNATGTLQVYGYA